MELNKKEITNILQKKETKTGIEKYIKVMTLFNESNNLYEDIIFIKKFNGFYKLRQLPKLSYDGYYSFFEKNRNNKEITFKEIYEYLYNLTGKRHSSFTSKMLHTINPYKPIWDSKVIKALNIKVGNRERTDVYLEICEWYYNFLETDNGQLWISTFDEVYPAYKKQITKTKKMDFILWQYEGFAKTDVEK
jgi:hypothetical protein